jgi:hypothetical protein
MQEKNQIEDQVQNTTKINARKKINVMTRYRILQKSMQEKKIKLKTRYRKLQKLMQKKKINVKTQVE